MPTSHGLLYHAGVASNGIERPCQVLFSGSLWVPNSDDYGDSLYRVVTFLETKCDTAEKSVVLQVLKWEPDKETYTPRQQLHRLHYGTETREFFLDHYEVNEGIRGYTPCPLSELHKTFLYPYVNSMSSMELRDDKTYKIVSFFSEYRIKRQDPQGLAKGLSCTGNPSVGLVNKLALAVHEKAGLKEQDIPLVFIDPEIEQKHRDQYDEEQRAIQELAEEDEARRKQAEDEKERRKQEILEQEKLALAIHAQENHSPRGGGGGPTRHGAKVKSQQAAKSNVTTNSGGGSPTARSSRSSSKKEKADSSSLSNKEEELEEGGDSSDVGGSSSRRIPQPKRKGVETSAVTPAAKRAGRPKKDAAPLPPAAANQEYDDEEDDDEEARKEEQKQEEAHRRRMLEIKRKSDAAAKRAAEEEKAMAKLAADEKARKQRLREKEEKDLEDQIAEEEANALRLTALRSKLAEAQNKSEEAAEDVSRIRAERNAKKVAVEEVSSCTCCILILVFFANSSCCSRQHAEEQHAEEKSGSAAKVKPNPKGSKRLAPLPAHGASNDDPSALIQTNTKKDDGEGIDSIAAALQLLAERGFVVSSKDGEGDTGNATKKTSKKNKDDNSVEVGS